MYQVSGDLSQPAHSFGIGSTTENLWYVNELLETIFFEFWFSSHIYFEDDLEKTFKTFCIKEKIDRFYYIKIKTFRK